MHFSRRSFLKLSTAASLYVLPVLRASRVYGATGTAPRRIVFFHTPLGTVRNAWACTGSETNFSLSQILQPLAAH